MRELQKPRGAKVHILFQGIKIIGMAAAFLLAGPACDKKSLDDIKAGGKFYDPNALSLGGDSGSSLMLHARPLYSAELAAARGSLVDIGDYFFRLKFYKVEPTDADELTVSDSGREMVVSKDNIASGKIAIRPVIESRESWQDGEYLALLCRNYVRCLPPTAVTLSALGKCQAGGDSKSCSDLLFKDETAEAQFLGIAYPLIVRGSRLAAGDYDFAYIHAADRASGLALMEGSGDQLLLESASSQYEPITTATAQPQMLQGGSEGVFLDQLAGMSPDTFYGDNFSLRGDAKGTHSATTTARGPLDSASGGGNSAAAGGSTAPGSGNSPAGGGNSAAAGGNSASGGGNNASLFDAATGLMTDSSTWSTVGQVLTDSAAKVDWKSVSDAVALGLRNSDCFTAGVKIAVVEFDEDGSITAIGEKNIEEIRSGDYVYNPLLRSAFKVKDTIAAVNYEALYELTVASAEPAVSTTLTVTAAHPVVTKNGVKPVALLGQGDRVMLVNRLPVINKTDYSWFSLQKLVRRENRQGTRVYNFTIDLDVAPLKIELKNSGQDGDWYYAMARDLPACNMRGCSDFYVISNQLVSGDLGRQMISEKLIQDNFARINQKLDGTRK
jgi:hypothetical protein